ncbi:endoglucanase [Magallana gigas]|uniref:endoglucanase n=1 Tax=Magallana gigas TaxID=29159 RepID=UPI00334233CD
MWPLSVFCILAIGYVSCEQRCHGSPRMYNGKRCASTTRYNDYHKGACKCGPASGDSQFGWNHDHFVTAPNQMFFDEGYSGRCGQRCGKCVKLTTTGGYVPGQGSPTPAGQSHVFMVTNLCRNVYPNQNWCNQGTGPYGNGHNDYGYVAHFDLGNGANQISRIGWNNPEVTWEIVSCHGANTPTDEMYQHCQCAHHGKRSLNESTNGSENGF